MDTNAMICLRIPVAISLGQRILHGELALPAQASHVRVCIVNDGDKVERLNARRYAKRKVAVLNLHSADALSSGDLLHVIDWVRSRRLLQQLTISLVLPADDAVAALKAAHHRPASVSGVFVLPSKSATLAHSA
jgi:hypothetical protein